MTKKITRQDYLDGKITHEEYYSSIAKTAGLVVLPNHELVQLALKSNDEHYNDIRLGTWDAYASGSRSTLSKAFKDHGDSYSLAGAVCTLKQAVKERVDYIKSQE